ncbi:23S rRNA (adenine(2503)-C(2))-methyltransferase RlmN [Dermatobacter hominis]|uniref:23S rRNA (adenine(2503)-C(2))-methyltransferase RlmN n=1 Tax=Dermatobacter hominis TaxID=2884263 RepID=UPI001D12063D|nr:23S rRNA (adenine(2503)-C(2))-methyltransferase RlmN [Dermatobacter hominis]UDY36019.1 23S rRNA (adenine(2503)-C(2))-methyltransferase RlmN [Dermatobacter hominis]
MAAGSQRTRYDVGRAELDELLAGEPSYRVDQIWDGLYRQGKDPSELSNVPKALRARLESDLPTALTEVTRVTTDDGGTVKLLWELEGGSRIETVLMHYDDRTTVCVSTQAGCAMACGFCATGQAGFERQLGVGEIVEQVVEARREAGDRRVSNVVFMGMGEPLANYDRTWAAVHRLHDDIGIGARHLTLSTVGLVPGIRRLAVADLPVNLAVSLHAADDELRDELVPINRRYPLDQLVEACRDYVDRTRRRLSFEWAMISGVNDRFEDAARLAGIANDLRAHVNLIPLNSTPGYAVQGSSRNRVHAFAEDLRRRGVNVTLRDTRGSDIDAACGQLRAGHEAQPIAPPRRRS